MLESAAQPVLACERGARQEEVLTVPCLLRPLRCPQPLRCLYPKARLTAMPLLLPLQLQAPILLLPHTPPGPACSHSPEPGCRLTVPFPLPPPPPLLALPPPLQLPHPLPGLARSHNP